jgi:hypothetical protein
MTKHTKDWYFAAASANNLWAEPHVPGFPDTYTCELATGASQDSANQLWQETLFNVAKDTENSVVFDVTNATYLCVQYGLEKAGL